MPAPLINAMRVGKANGVGPFAGGAVTGADATHDENGMPLRHQEGALMHEVDAVANEAGEGLFGKAFMLGAGGWVGAKTVGWLKPNTIPTIGKYTYAPVHALDSLAFKDLSVKNLKANYFHQVGEFVNKHNKKGLLDASPWHAKAEALGGAKIADVKWSGVKNIVPYMKGKPMFSAVMMGGLAAAGAIGLLRSGKHAKDGLDDLIEVAQDLDGKQYSRTDMINHPEKLSPAMQEIRANLKAHLIPDAVGSVGHVIENGAFAAMGGPAAHAVGGLMGGMGGMGMMMGGMMLGQSAEAFTPSLDFVKSYLQVKDLQAEGQNPPPELYAQLLAAASSEVRRMGGAEVGQVQRLALQYSQENISAKNLVSEVFAKEPFAQRAAKIAEEMQAEQVAEGELDEVETPDAAEAAEAPKAVDKDEAPKAANENEKPSKVALSEAVHAGKMLAERTAQVGGRV